MCIKVAGYPHAHGTPPRGAELELAYLLGLWVLAKLDFFKSQG